MWRNIQSNQIKKNFFYYDIIFYLLNYRKNTNCSKDWSLPTVEIVYVTLHNYFRIYIKKPQSIHSLRTICQFQKSSYWNNPPPNFSCIKMLTNVFKLSEVLENIRETSNVLILPITFHILLPFFLRSSSLFTPSSSLTIRQEQDPWGRSLSSI